MPKPVGKFRLDVTLKSGAVVSVHVDDASFKSTQLGNKGMEWATPEGWTDKLLHVDLDEVAAVVVREY